MSYLLNTKPSSLQLSQAQSWRHTPNPGYAYDPGFLPGLSFGVRRSEAKAALCIVTGRHDAALVDRSADFGSD
ncbi:unnamed protein product [Heligmosomoides polygyrus]|uniref:SAM-dependent methyltransferase n=1 Tax=Heligmosomoides polygyrus TaxID=6339 RepID=A0A183GIR4_HELPZ|nr:unnamed protein product [Heligmosomoides polygyrus]